MRDEIPLLGLEGVPVLGVLGEIHLSEGQDMRGVMEKRLITTLGVAKKETSAPLSHRTTGAPIPTSSAVQKDASAFLYICQMSW